MRLRIWLGAVALGAVTAGAAAEAPVPKDFAQGLLVTTAPGLPVQQFTVPDAVYQGVARADLGDLRVFNAAGVVVPHALCTGATRLPATVEEVPLQVFALQSGARAPAGADTRVNVQTPNGTSVQIVEGGGNAVITPDTPGAVEAWVVDAATVLPIQALRLAWTAPDGASAVRVRIETSADLDRWHTVVPDTTLLHVAADGQALDRSRLELPQHGRDRYLRLTRGDGPPLRIERVTAEFLHEGAEAEPLWFRAEPVAMPLQSQSTPTSPDSFGFETRRRAPVQAARVTLPVANMALRVALETRRAPDATWIMRWTGDVSSVGAAGADATPPPAIAFSPSTDPFWRVRVLRGAETLGGASPGLELAYHPARLRFSAQGAEPFVVAYGSVRVPPAESRGCDDLLASFAEPQRASMIGAAQVTPAPMGPFGGNAMLTPLSQPTPVRQIVLWGVLLAGAAALVAMALALLRRVRGGDGDGDGGTAAP